MFVGGGGGSRENWGPEEMMMDVWSKEPRFAAGGWGGGGVCVLYEAQRRYSQEHGTVRE